MPADWRFWVDAIVSPKERMKAYISEYEVAEDIDRNPAYARLLSEVITLCNSKGITITRSHAFSGYDEIEEHIRESDVLIAIVDQYWVSSTWKMHELFYAHNHSGPMGHIQKRAQNTSVVVMLAEDVDNPNLARFSECNITIKKLPRVLENIKRKKLANNRIHRTRTSRAGDT